jgi:hypothetical protein
MSPVKPEFVLSRIEIGIYPIYDHCPDRNQLQN